MKLPHVTCGSSWLRIPDFLRTRAIKAWAVFRVPPRRANDNNRPFALDVADRIWKRGKP